MQRQFVSSENWTRNRWLFHLIERLQRWDLAIGSSYARLSDRHLARYMGRAMAAVMLTILLVAKWQAAARILGASEVGISDFAQRIMLLNYSLQIPFLALTVFLVVFRRPQVGGVARLSGILAALGGTLITTLFFYGSNARANDALVPASVILLAVGMGWAIWSLSALGRCFSVVPEARGLVNRGPYQWVRHPIYMGEIFATLGLLLPILSLFHFAIFVVFVALQVRRMNEEEAILATTFPEYQIYRLRTRKLIPGLW